MISYTLDEVTLSKDEYQSLLEDSMLLNCLRNAGVDNWDGWDYAVDAYNELENNIYE